MAKQSRGQCVFCKKSYAKGGMTRHLQACQARQEAQEAVAGKTKPVKLFHLVAEGLYTPEYWLHLELPATITLEDLDQFLRDIWLECCGHLSMFEIEGQRYTQLFDDGYFPEDKAMTVKLGQVFRPGLEMDYEYDFGSSTDLRLKVVDERTGRVPDQEIKLMARNDPPEILCDVCGKPATEICVMCLYEGEGALCEEHVKAHKCGEDYLLPVVNSPRVGVCGYSGGAYD
jgi:hypothetical protein